jgi:hypothetical protein
MNYKSVYAYWLFDEIKSGKKVYALDRKFRKVSLVNDLTIDQVVAVINSAEAEPSRYEFWYEEEVKVTEEKENA